MPDTNPSDKHDTLGQYDGDYTIDVAAGRHTVKVENTGEDWVMVSYIVERAERKSTSDLRLYGMRGKTVSLIWIQNKMHNFNRIHITGHQPDSVAPTILTVPGWPKGKYHVVFWDTYKGVPTETREAHSTGGSLTCPVPQMYRTPSGSGPRSLPSSHPASPGCVPQASRIWAADTTRVSPPSEVISTWFGPTKRPSPQAVFTMLRLN